MSLAFQPNCFRDLFFSVHGEKLTAKIFHVCVKDEPTYHFASMTYILDALKQVPFRLETLMRTLVHKYRQTHIALKEMNVANRNILQVENCISFFLTVWPCVPVRALTSIITDAHFPLLTAYCCHLLTSISRRSLPPSSNLHCLGLPILVLPFGLLSKSS